MNVRRSFGMPSCLLQYPEMPSRVRPRLDAVVARADAKRLVEAAAEVEGAVAADFGGDLLERAPGVAQEAGGLAEAELAAGVGDSLAGTLPGHVSQPGRREGHGR